MYTIPWNSFTNAPSTTSVTRDADQATIPTDPANTDYAAYLKWEAIEGNNAAIASAPTSSASGVIADSAKSLALAQAKTLVAQGDTQGAINALLALMET